MPGSTTNVEFGYWVKSGKVLYGRPKDAVKVKYLDWLYKVGCGLNPIRSSDTLLE